MQGTTITVFNFHEKSGLWYPSVIENVRFVGNTAKVSTTNGTNNSDSAEFIIYSDAEKRIHTTTGLKCYTGIKSYNSHDTPVQYITFNPERDFIYIGVWTSAEPICNDDYDSGFYHELNDKNDDVYMITSASYFDLIPHFEIGGR